MPVDCFVHVCAVHMAALPPVKISTWILLPIPMISQPISSITHLTVICTERDHQCYAWSKRCRNLITIKQTRNPPVEGGTFKFCTVNMQFIRNKTGDFMDYVCRNKINMAAVTETWLSENDAVARAMATPTGYKFDSHSRQHSRGGGVALLYRDSLTVTKTTSGGKLTFEFSQWSVQHTSNGFCIVVVYRPPQSADHLVTTNDIFKEFDHQSFCYLVPS